MDEVRFVLELQGEVDIGTFDSSVHDVRNLLEDIAARIAPAAVAWRWDDTPCVGLVATPNGADHAALRRIVEEALAAFTSVASAENGQVVWPEAVSNKGIRAITRLLGRLDRIGAVTVKADDLPPLTIDYAKITKEVGERTDPSEYTAIEGYLDLISVRGHLRFSIQDQLSGKHVRCTVSDSMLQEVKEHLGKQVVAEGLLRYDRNGLPYALSEITGIWERPHETRPIEALVGALPDFTGPMSPEDYVRHLRGENGNDDD